MPRAKKKITKADFIRKQPMSIPAIEVVERAKEKGLTISEKYVYTMRSLMKKAPKKKAPAPKKVAKKKVTKKTPARVRDIDRIKKMTAGKSPLVDEDFFIPAVGEVEQKALALDLRELVFRLGLVQVKKLVNKFEKQLEAGRLFQD